MNEIQVTLTAIRNTLEQIEIRATVDNLEKLLACQQLLGQLIEKAGENGGQDHAE